MAELKQAGEGKPKSNEIVDRWALEFDVPYVSRLSSLEQYNWINYVSNKKDSEFTKLKLTCLHIHTMRHFIDKTNNADNKDNPDVIKNLEMTINKGEIVGICGQVGHGKTSLFHALLGEMRLTTSMRTKMDTYVPEDGLKELNYGNDEPIENDPRFDPEIPHIYINGSVAYFSQQSHIFSKTIRENILFNHAYEEEKYNAIIKMCCLEDDFKIFPAGDLTEVGGRGVTLSGG